MWTPIIEGCGFPPTSWTQVCRSAEQGSLARDALESLCRDYWYPLFGFARRNGYNDHDAQDLVQGFFAYLLDGNCLARADRSRGRLRCYLLGALKHYIASERRKENRQKRGGGHTDLPFVIDWKEADGRFAAEPTCDDSQQPDRQFDRRWARAILDRVLNRLAEEHAEKGKSAAFRALSQYLGRDTSEKTYLETAARLGLKEGAVKVAVHRMRKRYGELLHDEIARTLSIPEAVPEELDALIEALR